MALAVNFCGPLAFECSEDAEHRLRAALLRASGDAVRAFQRLKWQHWLAVRGAIFYKIEKLKDILFLWETKNCFGQRPVK